MSATELAQYLSECEQAPVLLDVREPWEFQLGHIRDSVLIPLGQLLHSLETLDNQQETVVICHHGVRSMRAAYVLEHHGFDRVINLRGGVDAWAKEVDPAFPQY